MTRATPVAPKQIVSMSIVGIALASASMAVVGQPSTGAARSSDTVYVAPNGDDSRSGKLPAEALRSLKRVQQLLKSQSLRIEGKQLTVKMLPGTYRNMGVDWDYVAPGKQIVFEPAEATPPGKYSVIVSGNGDELGQFFRLRITEPSTTPVNTGIVIRNLHVTDFCEGVSLGDWKSKGPAAGNVIEGNLFSRIGSKYETPTPQPTGKPLPDGKCVAGIRVQDSTQNTIRGNTFAQIENLPSGQTGAKKYGPALLHAIYVSNKSTANRIENNTFREFTGSPVRIRASSNDNVVAGNTFESPIYVAQTEGKYTISAVSQWYCNDAVKVCKDKAEDGQAECPSTGLEIVGNKVGSGMILYADDSQSKKATCAASTSVSEAQRQPKLKDNTTAR